MKSTLLTTIMLIASIVGIFASGRPLKEQAADASASALSRNLLDTGINTGGGANNNYGTQCNGSGSNCFDNRTPTTYNGPVNNGGGNQQNCSGNSGCSANNGGGGTSNQNNGRRLKNV